LSCWAWPKKRGGKEVTWAERTQVESLSLLHRPRAVRLAGQSLVERLSSPWLAYS
jgi:hypothetical protein